MLLFQSPIASPAARKAEHVGGDLHSLSQLDAKVFLDTFDAFTASVCILRQACKINRLSIGIGSVGSPRRH